MSMVFYNGIRNLPDRCTSGLHIQANGGFVIIDNERIEYTLFLYGVTNILWEDGLQKFESVRNFLQVANNISVVQGYNPSRERLCSNNNYPELTKPEEDPYRTVRDITTRACTSAGIELSLNTIFLITLYILTNEDLEDEDRRRDFLTSAQSLAKFRE